MLVVIKGAGDLATGIAHRLKRSGFHIVMTEIDKPTTVRRTVAFSQAVFDNEVEIEGIKGVKVKDIDEIYNEIKKGNIPVIIDEKASIIKSLKPQVVVDAIIAKRNISTSIYDAPIVIGVGPGVSCICTVESSLASVLSTGALTSGPLPVDVLTILISIAVRISSPSVLPITSPLLE